MLLLGLCVTTLATHLPGLLGVAAWCLIVLLGLGGMTLAILDRRIPVFVPVDAAPPSAPNPPSNLSATPKAD
jgi:hypothetical protein